MPLRKLIMKGETNMKYRRVITMLASASLAISIPVTSLAAEVNLVVPNKIGTSNHADTQGETARSTRYSATVTRDIFRGGRQYFAL